MKAKKIAISIPEPVLEAVDQLASKRGESRSGLISDILSRVARVKRDRDITARINTLFEDEGILAEQKRTADELLKASPWRDETW